MSRPSVERRATDPASRSIDDLYRKFAETGTSSPMYRRISDSLSRSTASLRVLELLPPSQRYPAAVLAVLHDLALAGRLPVLAAAYAAGDIDAAVDAVRQALPDLAERSAETGRRSLRRDETVRGAVPYPAIAEAARQAGATRIGLIDIGGSAGFNLLVDRVGISYTGAAYDGVRVLGDPGSPVQLMASVVGDRPVPAYPLPPVVTRMGLDRDPVDVTDPDGARWLRACLPPDQPERTARLETELALLATDPPRLLRGEPAGSLAKAISWVPEDALPVITTTWALSRLAASRRARLVRALDEASIARPVAWVSAEGVGVAPSIPTLGDRPASGHSIIGLRLFGPAARPAEALGRCWSRGRLLSWFG